MDVDHSYSNVHWPLLLKRLIISAEEWFAQEKCFGEEAVLPATGKSAKDLVYDAVEEFIDRNSDWRPNSPEKVTDELYLLLRKVIRHDFLDLVKKGRAYKTTKVLDIRGDEEGKASSYNTESGVDNLASVSDEDSYIFDTVITLRDVSKIVEGDSELKEVVEAVLQQGCIKREDIAACLGISVQEVTKRKRRLRLKLTLWRRSIH